MKPFMNSKVKTSVYTNPLFGIVLGIVFLGIAGVVIFTGSNIQRSIKSVLFYGVLGLGLLLWGIVKLKKITKQKETVNLNAEDIATLNKAIEEETRDRES